MKTPPLLRGGLGSLPIGALKAVAMPAAPPSTQPMPWKDTEGTVPEGHQRDGPNPDDHLDVQDDGTLAPDVHL